MACGAGNCSVVFNDTIAFGEDIMPVAWKSSLANQAANDARRLSAMAVTSMAEFERVNMGPTDDGYASYDSSDDWDMDDHDSIEDEVQLEDSLQYRDPSFLLQQHKRRLAGESEARDAVVYMKSPAHTHGRELAAPSYYEDPLLSCVCQPNMYGSQNVPKPSGQVYPVTQTHMCFKQCGCDFVRGGTDKCFDGPDGSGVCQCKEHFVNADCGACEANYYGSDCQTHCLASDKCNGRGSCNGNTGECSCSGSWSGPHCTCPGCSGHGSCTGGVNSTCACAGGWLGDNCQYSPAQADATHWHVEATGNDTATDFDACIYGNAKCGSGHRFKKVLCMQQYVDAATQELVTKQVADAYCQQHTVNYFAANPNLTATLTEEEFKTGSRSWGGMEYPKVRTQAVCEPIAGQMQASCDCLTYPLGLVEI